MLFVIGQLAVGGAGRQLVELVKRLDRETIETHVAVFYSDGGLQEEVSRLDGVVVHDLGKRGRYDVVGFLWRWFSVLRRVRPHVVHGYLDNANLLALTSRWVGDCRVVWGVRSSDMDFTRYDWLHGAAFRAGCRFSGGVDLAIFNSEAGLRFHRARGYRCRRTVVVPNGIDSPRYERDEAARERLRTSWGMTRDRILVGIVARLDPMKGQAVFLDAAARLASSTPSLAFVVVGGGAPREEAALRAAASCRGLEGRVIWTGMRSDLAAIYSAMDIAVSASLYGEGFSNSIGEAMAAGLPMVVTDVGDAAAVVGDTAFVVPCNDVEALAGALRGLVEMDSGSRAAMGARARARVRERNSLEKLEKSTREQLLAVCDSHG